MENKKFIVDDEGYPLQRSLDWVKQKCINFNTVIDFIVNDFKKCAKSIPYTSYHSRKDNKNKETVIEFSTGGWSGSEKFIKAVLQRPVKILFYSAWRRGGHYEFHINQSYIEALNKNERPIK